MSLFLRISTNLPSSVVALRLAQAVAPTLSILPLKPIKIQTWLAQYSNKSFVGKVENNHFKLVLLKPIDGVKFWRANSVVLVGTIGNEVIKAHLRPPIFNLVFIILFTVAMITGFVLSYYGPSNTDTVRLIFAILLLLPIIVLICVFQIEAHFVEKTLRSALAEPIINE